MECTEVSTCCILTSTCHQQSIQSCLLTFDTSLLPPALCMYASVPVTLSMPVPTALAVALYAPTALSVALYGPVASALFVHAPHNRCFEYSSPKIDLPSVEVVLQSKTNRAKGCD